MAGKSFGRQGRDASLARNRRLASGLRKDIEQQLAEARLADIERRYRERRALPSLALTRSEAGDA